MALFTRKVDYALLVLWHLHQRVEGSCARVIAERLNLSRPFVANILKELCHKRFVTSHRGVKGGYVLLRPAAEVNLADFIEAMDDSFRLAECSSNAVAHDGCTLEGLCPLRGPIADVQARLRDVLRGVTLAELFRPCPSNGPITLGTPAMHLAGMPRLSTTEL